MNVHNHSTLFIICHLIYLNFNTHAKHVSAQLINSIYGILTNALYNNIADERLNKNTSYLL